MSLGHVIFAIAYSSRLLSWSQLSTASENCVAIDHCLVEKIKWTGHDWKKLYSKESDFSRVCGTGSDDISIDDGGVSISILNSDSKSKSPIASQPRVSVALYSYKRTFVVASAMAPLNATSINFSYRTSPKGKEFIEVTCFKK